MRSEDDSTRAGMSAFRFAGAGQAITFNCMPCGKNKRQLGSRRRRYAGALITVCGDCAEGMDKRTAKHAA
jgi:hypothetical protein